MNGQQLYDLYVQANDECSVGVDTWEELTYEDTAMWNRFAELVGDNQ